MKNISIREFLNGSRDNYSGFYDWFCSDKSLRAKADSFVSKILFLTKEGIINQDTCYVWFKNNCPCDGSLYDDMRISTLNNPSEYLGGFCPRTGHKRENKCSIWYFKGNRDLVNHEFLNWSEFKKEVKTNKLFKETLISAFWRN